MKDFFDTWKFKILVAVAVFLVGIMAYAGANGRLTAAPQELLGVVREADLTSCKVMTVLHPSFNAAGVVSRTRDNGIITGSADYAADGLCILSNLARSTLSREGDQVITTGLGGVFPPDVLVGVIKELTPEASGKSTLAVIQPGADPRTVRHVFIITNY